MLVISNKLAEDTLEKTKKLKLPVQKVPQLKPQFIKNDYNHPSIIIKGCVCVHNASVLL